MKTYIKLFLLLFSIGFTTNSIAQEKTQSDYPRYTIAVQPFYLLNGGLRVDFEKQLGNSKRWLQANISGFYLPHKDESSSTWETMNSDYDPFCKLNGLGIGFAYKSFFYRPSLYYSAGVSYTHYRVTYSDFDYFEFEEDGLKYYEYFQADHRQIFNKLTASLCLGIQSDVRKKMFFDTYLGIGFSHSFYDDRKRNYNDNVLGYGYRGFHVTGGVRIGFGIK